MQRHIHSWLGVLVLSIAFGIGLAFVGAAYSEHAPIAWEESGVHAPRPLQPIAVGGIHRSTLMDAPFYAAAADAAPELALDGPVRGIILPHHLVASPRIFAALAAVARARHPKRIIVIGPDHLGRSRYPAITSAGAWTTPFGFVLPDSDAIDALVRAEVAVPDEPIFGVEHSIAALVPFFAKTFPDARIVPILVNQRLSPEQVERLAAALPMDEGTLLVASVDFSHYLSARAALFHDETAIATLAAGDRSGVDALEIDSPETISVFLPALARVGATGMRTLSHTTSADFGGSPVETTSHLIATFAVPEPGAVSAEHESVTILAVGDLMFDRDVRTRMARYGEEYPFAKIRGAEDRYFRGVDITTGNLEGAIATRRAPEKTMDFAFDRGVADFLATFGFDAVNLANNHGLDQGRQGKTETETALHASGIGSFGDQVADDGVAWTTTMRGTRVAMLGFNVTDNQLDEAKAKAAVQEAAAANDVVIVQAHWGTEYATRPTEAQRSIGRKFVEWGATAVIGHHPHVMQGMEVWKGRPIFWSLGNFIFDQDWSVETRRGLAVGLAIRETGLTAYLFPLTIEKSQPALTTDDLDRELRAAFVERSDLPDDLASQARTGIMHMSFELP